MLRIKIILPSNYGNKGQRRLPQVPLFNPCPRFYASKSLVITKRFLKLFLTLNNI